MYAHLDSRKRLYETTLILQWNLVIHDLINLEKTREIDPRPHWKLKIQVVLLLIMMLTLLMSMITMKMRKLPLPLIMTRSWQQ
jgi:hypothetical protein